MTVAGASPPPGPTLERVEGVFSPLMGPYFPRPCEAWELLYIGHYMRILTGSCGKLTKGPVSCSQVIALREGIPWIL